MEFLWDFEFHKFKIVLKSYTSQPISEIVMFHNKFSR